jgi:hypothetical protein
VIGMMPGATYQFRIAAINAEGTGSYSQPSAPLTMQTAEVSLPGKVSSFTKGKFIKTGRTYKVTVRWALPAADGGTSVTGYVARVGTGGRWSTWSNVDSAVTVVTSLRIGTRYTLQVRAVNERGPGAIASYALTTPRR